MARFIVSYFLFAACMTAVVLGVGMLRNGASSWDDALRSHWPLILLMPLVTIYVLRKVSQSMEGQ